MFRGRLDGISRTSLSGWAIKDDGGEPTNVVLYVNGQRWAELVCDKPRPDLQNIAGLTRCDLGFEFRFPSPLPADIDISISVRDKESAELLPGGQALLPSQASSAGLTPILVTAPGRSGTTRLMGKLARSNKIVVAESHPYEIRLLAYYSTAAHVLSARADFERSMHPDRLQGSGFEVGFNPFSRDADVPWFKNPALSRELFSEYAPREILGVFRKIVNEYYLRLRDDQRKSGALYFAEKANNLLERSRQFPRAAFGAAREIVLIRDPRDLFCSRRDYFKLHDVSNPQPIIHSAKELTKIVDEKRSDTLAIRYEDLVLDDAGVSKEIADFLDIEAPTATEGPKDLELFTRHATSETPEASIGRWRTELDNDTIDFITSRCRPFLERFGYPV
jgi:Sulfotransferase family